MMNVNTDKQGRFTGVSSPRKEQGMKRTAAIRRIFLIAAFFCAFFGTISGISAEEVPVLEPSDAALGTVSSEEESVWGISNGAFSAGFSLTGTSEEVSVSFEASGAELASGYIFNALPHRQVLRAVRPSGAWLTGSDFRLYSALRALISSVADGTETSTAFAIPAAKVFEQDRFTAEELGLETLVNDEGKITLAAQAAFQAKVEELLTEIHFSAVMNCLLADSPYELYWFNKSYLAPTNNFEMWATKADGVYNKLVIHGDYLVTLIVSPDYAEGEIGDDGNWTYARDRVDSRYGESVAQAAANARAILSKYAEEDDYGKICGYRDAICALADYNHDVVGDDVPYGDPWQLIWVFDGKPNTKVVCEGYAKAFQYLCDLGTTSVVAISVQGRVPGGAHMWNIVTIDGRNYLADLTNWDAGIELFLKGYSGGDPVSGYVILHSGGTIRYIYNRELIERAENELVLSQWDYDPGSTEGVAVLPSALVSIEDEAFAGTKIEAFDVPAGVTGIGDAAFGTNTDEIVIWAEEGSDAWEYGAEHGMRVLRR